MGYRKLRVVSPLKLPAMQVPPIFYKSTNIVLHENHKVICSGQMVPTPKIYGIGSWTKGAVLRQMIDRILKTYGEVNTTANGFPPENLHGEILLEVIVNQ